ncbi:MAG: LacI family transcriptional regulator [Anaerolineales bacterium]|nr:LacI family transcriptional regulator [Anaerolineales bacterium]
MSNKSAATIKDIAKIAGITPGTVSRALNGSSLVKKETKTRILKIAEELDYSPNLIARRLSTGKTFAIGVVVPFFTRAAVSTRLDGVVSFLSNSQYDLVIHDIESPKQRSIGFRDILRPERIDGALIISMPIVNEDIIHLKNSKVPVVFIDQKHPELADFDSLIIDDVVSGYEATKYLIELGHKKIGFIGDITEVLTKPDADILDQKNPFLFTASRDRYAGYKKALSEARIPISPDYYGEDQHGYNEARELALHMLSVDDPPTAIFAASDTQAFGVIQAARKLGFLIPEDLSVIGFDDIPAAELMQLTTTRQLLFESGRKGVELLLQAINGIRKERTTISFPTEIVIRNTTAPPRIQ